MPFNTRQALLSADEVARVLGVSRKTVYKLARQGEIVSLRVGGLLRFIESDLRAYLSRSRGVTSKYDQSQGGTHD
jgi:excisionase family DNA binding protein